MRKFILVCIAACLYYSGLVKLALWWQRRSGRILVVLNYHRATGGDIRRHLLYLSRHYRILQLEAALEELYTPHKDKQKTWDQRIPLVLTFDDGYHDNYTHVFTLARELRIPITLFLIPGYVESGDRFWWLEGKRFAHSTLLNEAVIDGRIYYLDFTKGRKALAQAIDNRLRHARSVEEREAFLTSACEKLAFPDRVMAEDDDERPLTWAEVREMEESGWVSFGAHTMHHPMLAYLADPQELRREVEECRTVLERQLGHSVRTFAYPVGQMKYLGDTVIQAVRQAGYNWAFTTLYGFNTPESDPYLLRRIEVSVSQHWLVMVAEAAGLWYFFSRLRKVPFVHRHFTKTSWN